MKKITKCFLSVLAVSSMSVVFASCADNSSSATNPIDTSSNVISSESISSVSEPEPVPFKFDTAYLNSVKNDVLNKDLYLKLDNLTIPTSNYALSGSLYFKVVNNHINGGIKLTSNDKYMQLDSNIVINIEDGFVYLNEKSYDEYTNYITTEDKNYEEHIYKPYAYNQCCTIESLLELIELDVTEEDLVTYYNDAIEQLTNYSISEDVLDYINYEETANEIVMTPDYDAIDTKITEYYNYYDTYTFSEAVNAILGDGSFDKLKTTIPLLTSQNVRSLLAMLKLNGFDYEEYLEKLKTICDETGNEQLTAIYNAINDKLHDKEFLNSIVGDIIIELLNLVDENGDPISVDDLNDKVIEFLDENKDVVVKTLIDNITNSTTVSETAKKIFDAYKAIMAEIKTSTINVVADKDGHFKSATVAYTSDDVKINGSIVCEAPEEISVKKLDFNPTAAEEYKAILATYFDDEYSPIVENGKVVGYQKQATYADIDYDDNSIVNLSDVTYSYYYSDSYMYEEDETNIYFTPVFNYKKLTATKEYQFESDEAASAAINNNDYSAGTLVNEVTDTDHISTRSFGDYIQYNKSTKEYTSIEDIPEEELTFDHQTDQVGTYGEEGFVPGVKYYKDSKGNTIEYKFYLEEV